MRKLNNLKTLDNSQRVFINKLLIILIISTIPFSPFLISFFEICFFLFWIFDKNIISKIKKIETGAVIFTIIFIIHLFGLIHTSDFEYALNDIKIKLPLLIIPIILSTSNKLNLKELKIIFIFLTLSVLVKIIISSYVFAQSDYIKINEAINFSGRISHIRFALLVNISFFVCLYFFIKNKKNKLEKITLLVVFVIQLLFLYVLQSLTGLVIFVILSYFSLFYFLKNYKYLKIILASASLIFPLLVLLYLINIYTTEFNHKMPNTSKLPKYTAKKNLYIHDTTKLIIENKKYIGLYLCEKELKYEWNLVSKNKKYNEVKYTLIRYLTSKSYKKDAQGVRKLNKKDIINIENGLANHIFEKKYSLYSYIYKILWEFDIYIKLYNPSGHSKTQRLEFLKIGFSIIKENFLFGVGTGDVQKEYNIKYSKNKSIINDKWRLRTHNQYITFIITFGIIGFLIIIFAYIYPIIIRTNRDTYFTIIVLIILSFSMLTEDTIETQSGATIFSIFYSLIMFTFKKGLRPI